MQGNKETHVTLAVRLEIVMSTLHTVVKNTKDTEGLYT